MPYALAVKQLRHPEKVRDDPENPRKFPKIQPSPPFFATETCRSPDGQPYLPIVESGLQRYEQRSELTNNNPSII